MLTRSEVEEFSNTYYNDIFSFCCSHLKNEHDAADVTQDVFLLFTEKADTLTTQNIRAWLFSVASNKIKEKYRERVIRTRFVELDESLHPYITDEDLFDSLTQSFVDDFEIMEKKLKLLSKLEPHERELLMDLYERKMKYSQAAEKHNISVKNVSVRALRARRKIKEMAELSFMTLLFVLIKLHLI